MSLFPNNYARLSKSLMQAFSLAICIYVFSCRILIAAPTVSCNRGSISLSTNDLKLQEDAVRGDGAAALRVSSWYFEQGDLSSAEFWSSISAEDGGAEYEYNNAEYLMNRDDTDSQLRSIFWMQRALKGADKALASYINPALDQRVEILSHSGNLCVALAKGINKQISLPNLADAGKSGLLGDEPLSLRIQALCGNTEAARFLVNYYGSIGEVKQGIYFTTIGAENGDLALQLKLAQILSQQLSDQEDQTRAKFWALRVLNESTDPAFVTSAKKIIDCQGG